MVMFHSTTVPLCKLSVECRLWCLQGILVKSVSNKAVVDLPESQSDQDQVVGALPHSGTRRGGSDGARGLIFHTRSSKKMIMETLGAPGTLSIMTILLEAR